MFPQGASLKKLTANLKLSSTRLKIAQKKHGEISVKERKEIADYLAVGRDDRARIRVEKLIRDDLQVEAMEITEIFCDLLSSRISLLQSEK